MDAELIIILVVEVVVAVVVAVLVVLEMLKFQIQIPTARQLKEVMILSVLVDSYQHQQFLL